MRFTIIMLAVLVGLSGCCKKKTISERIMEKAMKTATGNKAEFDISGDKVRITTDEGDVVIAGGADATLPDNLPDDVPIYKGAGVMQTVDTGDGGFSIMLQTSDSMTKVAEYYKKALADKGWNDEGSVNMPSHTMMTCSKGNNGLHVMIAGGEEGKTMISLTGGKSN